MVPRVDSLAGLLERDVLGPPVQVERADRRVPIPPAKDEGHERPPGEAARRLSVSSHPIRTRAERTSSRSPIKTRLRGSPDTVPASLIVLSFAAEAELAQLFPDWEVGAMPPFANLYDLPVYFAMPMTQAESPDRGRDLRALTRELNIKPAREPVRSRIVRSPSGGRQAPPDGTTKRWPSTANSCPAARRRGPALPPHR